MTTATPERTVGARHAVPEDVDIKRALAQEQCENALLNFDAAVEANENLQIDGDVLAGTTFGGAKFEKDSLHIVHLDRKVSYAVTVEAIVKQDLATVIEALETGVRDKLYGVTRIVGYYSRTSNWNKSKIGELRDRHNGDYGVEKVASKC